MTQVRRSSRSVSLDMRELVLSPSRALLSDTHVHAHDWSHARADDFPDYRAFMVEEHAEESVDFCLELREYMGVVAKGECGHDELHEKAQALFSKFLPQGAPCQINVSAKALKETRKALERGEVDPSIFARAQNEVRSVHGSVWKTTS